MIYYYLVEARCLDMLCVPVQQFQLVGKDTPSILACCSCGTKIVNKNNILKDAVSAMPLNRIKSILNKYNNFKFLVQKLNIIDNGVLITSYYL